MSRRASRGRRAFASRAAFPSDPYLILYRITVLPQTFAKDSPARLHAAAPLSAGLPSAPRRPGESYRRIGIALATRRRLALASADSAVPLDVAATLICEAGLLLERLDRRRISCPSSLLDRAASASRLARPLGAADADYLRALCCRSWRRSRDEPDLPVRLIDRIGAGSAERVVEHLERVELLERAIRWEIAAIGAGSRMAGWGCEAVLAGFRPEW